MLFCHTVLKTFQVSSKCKRNVGSLWRAGFFRQTKLGSGAVQCHFDLLLTLHVMWSNVPVHVVVVEATPSCQYCLAVEWGGGRSLSQRTLVVQL